MEWAWVKVRNVVLVVMYVGYCIWGAVTGKREGVE